MKASCREKSESQMNSLNKHNRVGIALLVLRLTVFLVMSIWTIDKFVRPDHAASVYERFYFLRGLGPAMMYGIGLVELAILVGFVIGFAPRLTYGLVLLFHAVSTLSSFRQYFHPFENVALSPSLVGCVLTDSRRDTSSKVRSRPGMS
jgi:uncharacterized membrane protein YkgB